MKENYLYDAGQRYAHDAMQAFAGFTIPEYVRGLIEAQLMLAYVSGAGDVYKELKAVLRLWSKEIPLDSLDLPVH